MVVCGSYFVSNVERNLRTSSMKRIKVQRTLFVEFKTTISKLVEKRNIKEILFKCV
jgi:hypothetical protein